MGWFRTLAGRTRGQIHIVDNGRVGCPRRGADVDVETCLACAHFTGLGTVDGEHVLTCHGWGRSEQALPAPFVEGGF